MHRNAFPDDRMNAFLRTLRPALPFRALIPALLLFLPPAGAQPARRVTANQTATYDECIAFYRSLEKKYPVCRLTECGLTDAGRPLHLFVIDNDRVFDRRLMPAGKAVLLVMNGIHPGEPDGIDASMMLADDLLAGRLGRNALNHTVLCIIPAYNIGGMLNRGCCSRANQDGPEEYGFRGNARNLDLNRDFIKSDAENTRSFVRLFHRWDPDVFIDTHVSDGADYPYTMTLIATQHDKLQGPAGDYLKEKLTPALFAGMKARGDEMIPYVNTQRYGDSPDRGIYAFADHPRYSTGFAALFGTMGFVSETHMLKPFPRRVESTYRLLATLLDAVDGDAARIAAVHRETRAAFAAMHDFALDWMPDTTAFELLPFRGYEQKTRTSAITGRERIHYDRGAPYNKSIRFYDTYVPRKVVRAPACYILPAAWGEVVSRMAQNGVAMSPLPHDTVLSAEVYIIEDYTTADHPYEGRYLHSGCRVRAERQAVTFRAGDFVIPVNQGTNRYIVETLEPEGVDSWFAWGFFDAVLQQKEWFSSYVFEDKAEALLQEDPSLAGRLKAKAESDTAFANDPFQQLYFIYRNSPYFEPSFNRYPVARIPEPVDLRK